MTIMIAMNTVKTWKENTCLLAIFANVFSSQEGTLLQ